MEEQIVTTMAFPNERLDESVTVLRTERLNDSSPFDFTFRIVGVPDTDQDVTATWNKLMAEKKAEPELAAQNGTNGEVPKTVTQ